MHLLSCISMHLLADVTRVLHHRDLLLLFENRDGFCTVYLILVPLPSFAVDKATDVAARLWPGCRVVVAQWSQCLCAPRAELELSFRLCPSSPHTWHMAPVSERKHLLWPSYSLVVAAGANYSMSHLLHIQMSGLWYIPPSVSQPF